MRGHRVEMPGVEGNAFALSGSRDVVDILRPKLRVLERIVEGKPCELNGIALADAQQRTTQPFLFAVLHLEHGRLDRPGADIDSRCDGHDALPSLCPW